MTVYLDYNATCPVRPEAIEKMNEVLANPANPSSTHSFGRAAKKFLEDARQVLADNISAFTDEIVFTSSGTEANTTALCGFADRRVLISSIEHSSVMKARDDAEHIPVTKQGTLDLEALEKMLASSQKPAIVSVMLANNETGVIQPVAEIAAICKKHNALFHCDAIQAIGKIPVDFGAIGADMLVVSGHKFGGPVGAAALVVRRNLPFKPLLRGGSQEMNRRAGTSNVAAIAGFAAAIQVMDLDRMKMLRGWMDAMEAETGGIVFGKDAPRLPNTSCIAMQGVMSETQLIDFDLKGFAISGGSACASGKVAVSPVLVAMQVDKTIAPCAIRVSSGWQTQESDIKAFTDCWKQAASKLGKKAASA